MPQQHTPIVPGFLLGAGASVPAGFPSTTDISKIVFSGEGVFRHSDETYYLGTDLAPSPPYVPTCVQAITQVRAAIEPTLLSLRGTEPNYEDVLYALGQIADYHRGEIENPLVRPFIERISSSFTEIARQLGGRIDSVGELAGEAENYVRDVTWRLLNRTPTSVNHLTPIIHSVTKKGAIIGTLNHDNHLETHLRRVAVPIADGFGSDTNGVRYWQADFAPRENGVAIFKLHGSVDWYCLKPDRGTWYEERIGIPLNGDIWHTRSESGALQLPGSGRPIMAMGTFNKYVDYASSIFASVHSHWRLALSRVNRLLICGYSFGDKGINAQVIDWLYSRRENKILVIDPNAETFKVRARGAIRNKWDDWLVQGCLQAHNAKLEDLKCDELDEFFEK
jgi:hypothetical protein